jgi:pimeloyl-[acyl-carrier protein] methyl ester esterase
MRWAQRYPKKIERLILVASTPCFIQKPDWTCGMSIELLTAFSEALADNYLQTLRRFLALQVRGSEHERELLNQLRQGVERRGPPDMKALTSGLEMLRTCDFRSCLPEIPQSTLVIAGERDTLTPLLAAQFLSMTLPLAQLRVIHGAAHAPFLSHPERFVAHVKNFLYE